MRYDRKVLVKGDVVWNRQANVFAWCPSRVARAHGPTSLSTHSIGYQYSVRELLQNRTPMIRDIGEHRVVHHDSHNTGTSYGLGYVPGADIVFMLVKPYCLHELTPPNSLELFCLIHR